MGQQITQPITLIVGDTYNVWAGLTDTYGNPAYGETEWASSDEDVATVSVSSGVCTITAVAEGEATITATANGVEAEIEVEVVESTVANVTIYKQ